MVCLTSTARRCSGLVAVALLLACGCQRNWKEIIIKKRVHLDGYYVHIPSKRATTPTSYPPPAPYPTSYPKPTSPAQTPTATSTTTASTSTATSGSPSTSPSGGTSSPPVPGGPGGGGGGPGTGGGGGGGTGGGPAPAPPVMNPAPLPSPAPDPPVAQQAPPASPPEPVKTPKPPKPYKPAFLSGQGMAGVAYAGLINGPQRAGYPAEWYSFSAGAGIRCMIKLRPLPNQRFTFDLGYRLSHYFIDQQKFKAFPLAPGVHERERVTLNELTSGLCWRYKIKSETSFVKWIDAGVCGSYGLRSSNVFVDEQTATYSSIAKGARSRTKLVGLTYLRDFNYGITVRAGNDWLGAFATWRVSDMISVPAGEYQPDLPRLTIGVEVSAGW